MIRPLTCPICRIELPPGASLESRWFPFCGERCRNVDLYRWGEGRYAIVEPLTDDDLSAYEDEAGPLADPAADE